jgi:hypothetical protein
VNPPPLDLQLHRQRLLVRIAAQRLEVAELASRWQTPLQRADTVIDALRFLRDHPSLVAGAVGLLAWRARQGGVAKFAARAWGIYQAVAPFVRMRRP